MKTVFILVIAFFCAANAMYTYTPEWKNCTNSDLMSFEMHNVTIDEPPVAGQVSHFHLCGYNKEIWLISIRTLHITSSPNVVDQTVFYYSGVTWKQTACWDANITIPEGAPKTFTLNFDFMSLIRGRVGCAEVTVNL